MQSAVHSLIRGNVMHTITESIIVEIRDSLGMVESAGLCDTVQEVKDWYGEQGVDFSAVSSCDDGFTYLRA